MGVKHPARFSRPVLAVIAEIVAAERSRLGREPRILDPFAGTGLVHTLGSDTTGIEIEPEWAALHPRTMVGNALELPFPCWSFDMLISSPCYGNRLADHHDAQDGSVRRSYRHDLGRALHQQNAGQMHWGGQYRAFHRAAWREGNRILRGAHGSLGGVMVVNVSNHIRQGVEVDVVGWHLATLLALDLQVVAVRQVATPRMRYGANRQRVDGEHILILRKPTHEANREPDHRQHDLFDAPRGRSVCDVAVKETIL